MKVEVNTINPCKKQVAIEVEPENLKEDYNAICVEFQKRARVPGFRPGKAPFSVIRQRYREEIRKEFLDSAVQKFLREVMKSENLSPLVSPHVHDLSFSDNQPLRFKAVFEILPTIELSNYKGLEIEKIVPEVKKEEIESVLKQMQERMAEFLPVEGRSVQTGDFAMITYSGRVSDDSQPALGSKDIYCEIGGANTLPEFTENLMGASAGETRRFTLKYASDVPTKQLAGKEIEYSVELQSIKTKKIPELNDDFAKDVGQHDTLEELRRQIKADLTATKEHEARSRMQEVLLEKLIESNPFEIPEVLVKKQSEQRLNDYLRTLVMQGIHPQTLDIDWSAFQARQREMAIHDVKAALVLDRIADQEGIQIFDEEVEEEISRYAREANQPLGAVKSRLTKDGGTDRMKSRIRNRKSLDLLLSLATFKNPQSIIVQP